MGPGADALLGQALPWLEGSVQGVTHVGIFTLTTATALVMYLYAVFTDPGRCVCLERSRLGSLPQADCLARCAAFRQTGCPTWRVRRSSRLRKRHAATALRCHTQRPRLTRPALRSGFQGGEPRYCQKCKRHKPPRTHHCRQCDRCVLRMDHHCVWLNNCVGHRNYKAFFLFLLCTLRGVAWLARRTG